MTADVPARSNQMITLSAPLPHRQAHTLVPVGDALVDVGGVDDDGLAATVGGGEADLL